MAFSILNPPEHPDCLAARQILPDHLFWFCPPLSSIRPFAAGDRRPCESLKGVLAISEQLTPNMRAYVERSFGVPIIRTTASMRSAWLPGAAKRAAIMCTASTAWLRSCVKMAAPQRREQPAGSL